MGVPSCRQGGQECSLQRMPRLASGDQVGRRAEGSGPSVSPPPHHRASAVLPLSVPHPPFLLRDRVGLLSPHFCPHPGSSGGTFWVPPETSPSQLEEMPVALLWPLGGPPALPLSPCGEGVMGGRSRGAGLAPLPDHPPLSASEGAARGMRERAETVVLRKAAGAPA